MTRNAYVKTVDGWEQIATSVSAAPQGLAPIIPASAVNASIASDGKISFSGVSSIDINGAFTSNYANYTVVYNIISSTSAGAFNVQFRANGTTDTSANYSYSYYEANLGLSIVNTGSAASTSIRTGRYVATGSSGVFEVYAPEISSTRTRAVGRSFDDAYFAQGAGAWNVNKSHDGFTVSVPAGTITGTIQVYGYSALANPLDIPKASPNYLINGAFDFWQRGTSSTTNGVYLADRWIHYRDAGTHTVSRSTDVPADADVQYSLQFASTSGTNPDIIQRIESVNSLQFAGQRVTLSVWAKSTVGTNGLSWYSTYAGSTDNWSSPVLDASGSFTASMTVGNWTRYTATFNVNALATRGYAINIYRNVTTTSTTTLYAGVQLELGSLATRFERAGSTYTEEQNACFRYYYRAVAESAYGWFGQMHMASNVLGLLPITVPVNMRTIPHTLDATAIGTFQYFGATGTLSSFSLSTDGSNSRQITINVNGSGFAGAGSGFIRANNNAAAFIGVSAEL